MNRTLDKSLADELGITYGAAIRELASGAFLREAAKACGMRFPLLPWRGAEERLAFQLAWSGCLAALSLIVAVRMTPGLADDERLRRKVFFGTCAFVDGILSQRVAKMSAEGREAAERIRMKLLRAVEVEKITEDAFTLRFYALLKNGEASEAGRTEKLEKLLKRTTQLLEKITKSTLESDPKKSRKN